MKQEIIAFDPVAPYAGTVELADLLTEIEATIRRHVVLTPHAAAALAVWVLHTYTFQLREAVAYVAIESPEKRCGKTTLLSVLAAMSHKPLIASNITVGALFRAIDTYRPTLFIDEADTFLAGNSMMRGIINSGNTWRTAYVLRFSKMRRKTELTEQLVAGTDAGLRRYSSWCPKVIALIGETPDTIADRSIVVKMSRKLVAEPCAPLSELNVSEIRAKCARFVLDAEKSIAQHEPIRGEGLNDRAADTFDPLYVIARHAGPDWEQRLHEAALALSAAAHEESSPGEILLDILSIFADRAEEKMLTRDLVACLRSGPGVVNAAELLGAGMNELKLANLLRPYGIRPVNIRMGTRVNKGYLAADFQEALKRYVPKALVDARAKELMDLTSLRREAAAEAEKKEQELAQAEARLADDKGEAIDPRELLEELAKWGRSARESGPKNDGQKSV